MTPQFRLDHDAETQSRVIEILDLEISKMNAFTASIAMPLPFGRKWSVQGKYLFYFDTIELKLAGLIYYLGNK